MPLTLTRKVNQSIFIGDIEVRVVNAWQGGVKLSIDAPDDILIYREEAREKIEKRAALRAANELGANPDDTTAGRIPPT